MNEGETGMKRPEKNWNPCCDSMREAIGNNSYGPAGATEEGSITFSKGWNAPGCCGGGCYVLSDMKFCPWCATALPQLDPFGPADHPQKIDSE